MTLPLSGPISFAQINTEIQRPANQYLELTDPVVRRLAGKASGEISISDLYGKSFIFQRQINSLRINQVLSSLFSVEEWTSNVPKEVEVLGGVVIGSTNPNIAALRVGTSLGGTLKLINRGSIQAAGGTTSILTGGNAIQCDSQIFIDNFGEILSGGGNGGTGGQGGNGSFNTEAWDSPIYKIPSKGSGDGYYVLPQDMGGYIQVTYMYGWSQTTVNYGSWAAARGYYNVFGDGYFYGPADQVLNQYNSIRRYRIVGNPTSGGAPGLGGFGRGYGQSNASGNSGSPGGQGAGQGGQGGAGGGWGAPGQHGGTGSSGNVGSGVAGTPGGLAGIAITGYNPSLHKNYGTLLGRL